jgi:membrane-bound serine protease (ClpP class)
VPGVVGGLSLLLAFFAFQILPVNIAGVLLMVFGLTLFALEMVSTSFGLLAAGGIVSLMLGSLILIDSPMPELQVGLNFIIPVTLALATIMLLLARLVVRIQRERSVTGSSGMLNKVGRTLTAIEPGGTGKVSARGEIWTATAEESISVGETITIVDVTGLTLIVQRFATVSHEGDNR